MSRKYTNQNRIKFTSISEKYQSDKIYRAKISELHAGVITYVVDHFKNTKKYKQLVVDALNIITYAVYAGDPVIFDWAMSKPLDNVHNNEIDASMIEEVVGDIFLTVDGIEWDVKPSENADEEATDVKSSSDVEVSKDATATVAPVKKTSKTSKPRVSASPTPKQDLYIQSPVVPRFDYNKKWITGHEGADDLVIYTTLPEIPTRQNEISCTTDVTRMTYAELMNLYPNVVIHTRAPLMYEHIEGLDYEEDIGVLLPIDGYSREQLIDNIIQYPHFYKLLREVDGEFISFYTHVEIKGELHSILDVWDDLPDTKRIPRQREFIKEYVVRRYLLDLTLKNVKYQYPLFGSLDPFLTLFMPAESYISRGYKDTESLARQCVLSRVKYKLSRNPIMRRLDNAKLYL